MRTGFKIDVEGRTVGLISRGLDGVDFGMIFFRIPVKSFTDDTPFFHKDGANHWVWTGQASPLSCKFQRTGHKELVSFVYHAEFGLRMSGFDGSLFKKRVDELVRRKLDEVVNLLANSNILDGEP